MFAVQKQPKWQGLRMKRSRRYFLQCSKKKSFKNGIVPKTNSAFMRLIS